MSNLQSPLCTPDECRSNTETSKSNLLNVTFERQSQSNTEISKNNSASEIFKRPPWDYYFMDITNLTAQRSNCIRRKVGAVCVKDHRILSLGQNGTPRDTLNCYEGGCPRCNNLGVSSGQSLESCLCLHAEENALLFVKKEDLEDSTLYISLLPCVGCVKKILQCKIKRIVYQDTYSHSEQSLYLLQKYGILVDRIVHK